jgi:hypothetical protein
VLPTWSSRSAGAESEFWFRYAKRHGKKKIRPKTQVAPITIRNGGNFITAYTSYASCLRTY